jgi:hypothetical protein
VGAPQAQKVKNHRVIPGKHPTKTQNMIYFQILKIYPKKLGQAADEIFRVAACPL